MQTTTMIRNRTKKKNVYLLFTDTGSVLNNLIKRYTKAPYNHTSIAFDIELKELYSFGRLNPANPLLAGFVKEDIHSGTFARFAETNFSLYSFEVDEHTYNRMVAVIRDFERQKEKYRYNFIGLFGVMANRPIERQYAYFCSQFVATVFQRSGIEIFDKPPSLVRPDDFIKSGQLKYMYHGKLRDYNPELVREIHRIEERLNRSYFDEYADYSFARF